MKKLCVVCQEKVIEHDFGPAHPVRKERFQLFLERLHGDGLVDRLGLSVIDPDVSVDDGDILRAHDRSLLDEIKRLSEKGGRLDADTPVPQGTYERAKLQTGGLLHGGRLILNGEYDRVIQPVAFGGHHAMRRHGYVTFGFCYFNQEAIVVRRLQEEGLIKKALILDLDCHHGNGIQDIFYEDPSVLYMSFHQDPHTLYPAAYGFMEETGKGAGEGYNINVPLPPGTTCKSYMKALEEIFPPVAREFQPDLILYVFNGDTHFRDPLTNMALDVQCYGMMTDLVGRVSGELCAGRLLVEMGGGYDLEVATTASCYVTARLAEDTGYVPEDPYGEPPAESDSDAAAVERQISRLKSALAKWWHCF
jgi:acetoin utilization deacetylase AcuC-like enzyme